MFILGSVGYIFGLSRGWLSFGMSVQCLHWVVLGTSSVHDGFLRIVLSDLGTLRDSRCIA